MKRKMILAVVSAALLVVVPHLAHAEAGVVNSTQNPLQIAILHWYGANLTTSFPVASGNSIPRSVAFDGANIWG